MYECVCVQAVQQDPRVTQLVKDLNRSIQAAAEDSGDSIPAVLVLNKVSITFLQCMPRVYDLDLRVLGFHLYVCKCKQHRCRVLVTVYPLCLF